MTTQEILSKYKTIAVYGMSGNPSKPAYEIPEFMIEKGYNIIPINPKEEQILGKKVYHNLMDVPDKIEILDVFRPSQEVVEVVRQAIERKKAKGDIDVIWLQLGIYNDEAKALAENNGLEFIQDKCLKIEYNKMS
ncbi:MAG TPA: CoA-binding protein [Candidatus Kapabacteria bacterium]|nr:CoA-binding protein [Candidatus Kapabacteria bacterium]